MFGYYDSYTLYMLAPLGTTRANKDNSVLSGLLASDQVA